jgi:class 3 adenylate cyclase
VGLFGGSSSEYHLGLRPKCQGTDKPLKRKLAAILATDVVGYSRLMEQDEAGTFAAVRPAARNCWSHWSASTRDASSS